MRNLLIVLMCFFACSGTVLAQDKGKLTTEERTELITQWMDEELELSDDQLPKVKEINQVFSKGMEEVVATEGIRSKMAKFRSHGEKRDTALKEVLSPLQYKAFMSIKGNMRKEMKERSKNKREV